MNKKSKEALFEVTLDFVIIFLFILSIGVFSYIVPACIQSKS